VNHIYISHSFIYLFIHLFIFIFVHNSIFHYCAHATVAMLLNSPVKIILFSERGFRLSYLYKNTHSSS